MQVSRVIAAVSWTVVALVVPVACGSGAREASAEPLESTEDQRSEVGVTVYNNDLGLVREVRRIKLPAGRSELLFMDVASAIRPETVSVVTLEGKDVHVLEQNYEYDLLGPRKVLEKYVGRDVTIYVKNDETGEERPVRAKLLSVNNGEIFQIGDEISLGLPGRVVVPRLPANLMARPTLVWHLDASGAGERELEVSYLTRAMSWRADYVASLAPDEKTLDLTGWVTIDNRSGATYEDASLKLVAGDVHTVSEAPRPEMMQTFARDSRARPKAFAERGFFEYHLYELERKTTLKQNQKKQIELLSASAVPVRKRYIAESQFRTYSTSQGGDQPANKAAVKLELENTKESNLGRALPKGVVRVYKRDTDDALTFAGEDAIDHTPDGETVRLRLGDAFDVLWEREVSSFRELSKHEVDATVEITVKNRKDEAVTVTVVERFARERELVSSSLEARTPNAFTLEFDVPVAAKAETTLSYRVRAKR